jgi:tetratricopeptide (TPR) repeat protein
MASKFKWYWPVLCLAMAAGVTTADDAADERQRTAAVNQQIQKLIEELGSNHYATRERAASELSQLGLEAFDALHAAQLHQDIEIAERARYLLHSMKVLWSRPVDSADVKRLLKDYSQQSEDDRRSRIENLGKLDDAAGLSALCRLVRYEISQVLAKEAALVVMSRPQFAAPEHRAALREAIAEQIGDSQREPCRWLQAFERTLENPSATVDTWQQWIANEHKRLSAGGEPQTNNRIVRDLYRWQADLLQQVDRQDDAKQAMQQMVSLSDGTPNQLQEIIVWLMQRKAWSVVDEVAVRFPAPFEENPTLLYLLAEAQVESGDREAGEATALKAFKLTPDEGYVRITNAYKLQERGRFDWSEREYRSLIKPDEFTSRTGIDARVMLAEMLHDQKKDGDAAKVLSDLVKALESEQGVRDAIENAPIGARSPGEIISRMYYFLALDHLENQRVAEAKAALEKGADANAEDADLLIAMYRLPGADEAWKAKANKLIDDAASSFKATLDMLDARNTDLDTEQDTYETRYLQAVFCNQYSWLIGNTRGDLDLAIKLSHRSLELRPEQAGYMDTLAHCYFTKGDYENAVKWQTKAVKLDPHSGQIVRALKRFEEALAKKNQQQ